MAKQRWKAVKLKQKFDRQRFKNFTGRYSEDNMFISKVQHEKYDKYKYSEDNMIKRREKYEKMTLHRRVGAKRRSTLQRRELTPVSLPPFSRFLFLYFNLVLSNCALSRLIKTIVQAYKNHWVLRTSPDDWFFPVIRRIAQVTPDLNECSR